MLKSKSRALTTAGASTSATVLGRAKSCVVIRDSSLDEGEDDYNAYKRVSLRVRTQNMWRVDPWALLGLTANKWFHVVLNLKLKRCKVGIDWVPLILKCGSKLSLMRGLQVRVSLWISTFDSSDCFFVVVLVASVYLSCIAYAKFSFLLKRIISVKPIVIHIHHLKCHKLITISESS